MVTLQKRWIEETGTGRDRELDETNGAGRHSMVGSRVRNGSGNHKLINMYGHGIWLEPSLDVTTSSGSS